MRISDLRYLLLPGHGQSSLKEALDQGFGTFYDNIFLSWQHFWELTFKKLNSSSKVDMNEFLRQNVLSAFFLGEECKALLLFSFFDFRALMHRSHPYIQRYPEEFCLQMRESKNSLVMTMEYLIVDPSCRRSQIGVSLKDLICLLALRYFEQSPAASAIAVTRVDRSINEIFYKKGARALSAGENLHNVEVDLIEFQRPSKVIEGSQVEDFYLDQLWSNRWDLTSSDSIQNLKSANQNLV